MCKRCSRQAGFGTGYIAGYKKAGKYTETQQTDRQGYKVERPAVSEIRKVIFFNAVFTYFEPHSS